MFLRLFKGTGPGVIFLIVITLLLVWIRAFIDPGTDHVPLYDSNPMPLYGLLRLIAGENPFLGVTFSFLLVSLMALLLVNFNTTVIFINERTYLPALIYILFSGLIPQSQVLNPVLPASIFLIFAIMRIMGSYRKPGIAYNFFDTGILISTGSLFYANMIWFGLLIIIGIALLRTGTLMETMISLFGFITPFILTLGVFYIIGIDLNTIFLLFRDNLFGSSESYIFSGITIIALMYTGLIILFSIFYLQMLMNTRKIKTRKTFYLLFWVLFISGCLYFVLPSVSIEILWVLSIPASFFVAHYFVFVKKRLLAEILFTLLFLIIMVLQVLSLRT